MESIIIWKPLEACQFSDSNNPSALIEGISILHLQIEDTESIKLILTYF